MTDRLAASLEGYLSAIDYHYGPYKWVTSFNHLDWENSALLPTNHEDGGREGATAEVFLSNPVYLTYFEPCQGSAQYKELFVVVLAELLSKVEESFNLFSNSLNVVNLLPELAQEYTRSEYNPIIPHDLGPNIAVRASPSPFVCRSPFALLTG